MGEAGNSGAKMLVVEDEDGVADLFVTVLSREYDVDRATSGGEALAMLDESYNVVLLDRRMPDISGEETIEAIELRDVDCRIAMITAIEPDFDVIDMGFDDYLVKPVDSTALLETAERLLALEEYEDTYQELSSKLVKRNILEVEKPRHELEDTEEFLQLNERIAELERNLDEMEADREFDERLLPT